MWGSVETEAPTESQTASISPGGNDSSAEGFCPLYSVLENARRLPAEGPPSTKGVNSSIPGGMLTGNLVSAPTLTPSLQALEPHKLTELLSNPRGRETKKD